jgi:hypothetical protein
VDRVNRKFLDSDIHNAVFIRRDLKIHNPQRRRKLPPNTLFALMLPLKGISSAMASLKSTASSVHQVGDRAAERG